MYSRSEPYRRNEKVYFPHYERNGRGRSETKTAFGNSVKKLLQLKKLFTLEEIKHILLKLLFKPLSTTIVTVGIVLLSTPLWQQILIQWLNKQYTFNINIDDSSIYGLVLIIIGTFLKVYELYHEIQKLIPTKTAFKPSIEWAKSINEIAIKNAGKRYSPHLNINTNTVLSFDYLTHDLANYAVNQLSGKFGDNLFYDDITDADIAPSFDDAYARCSAYLGNDSVNDVITFKKEDIKIEKLADNKELDKIKFLIHELLNAIQKDIIPRIIQAQEGLLPLLKLVHEEIQKKQILFASINLRDRTDTYYVDSSLIDGAEGGVQRAIDFLNGSALKIYINKSLLITGEGLSGKTHMFCNVALKRLAREQPTLLFFGGAFSAEKTIIENMLSDLGLTPIPENEFLEALNQWGQECGTRTLIMIDAINERSPELWESQLVGFLEKLKSYSHIAIAFSIRDIEKRKIITSTNESYFQVNLVEIEHRGFENMEYEAVKHFCQCLGIEFPKIPLHTLQMFVNPGILLIYLETIQNSTQKLDQNFIQPLTIFKAYLSLLEEKFYKQYSNDVGMADQTVQSAIEAFIDLSSEDTYSHFFIEYKQALKELRPIHRKVLEFLIFEGVLNKTIFEDEELLYFTYQKFENFFIAHYLLKHFDKNITKIKTVLEEHNFMLQEAILMQIAETTGKEPFELFEDLLENRNLCQMYFKSLVWRNPNTITQKTFDYLLKIQSKHHMANDYFDLVMQLATYPNHPLNIENFHQKSLRKKMSDRDLFLIPYFHKSYQYESYVYRLIHWALDNREFDIDDESLQLYGITLGWFLISPNRELRDKTTKALVNLLTNHLDIIIVVLKEFEEVDDPYVYERLFAVAFGSAVRSKTTDHLKELCEYIYHTIFDQEFVYPHILLRDYAKNTIDYAIYKGITLDIDRNKTIPPYKSHFPEHLPTNEEIDALSAQFEDQDYGLSDIISSMTTEYGRGTGGYGDFGRYTFQSALYDWKKQINIDLLSNYAIKMIIERIGYDPIRHGQLERNITSGYQYSKYENIAERIGKKYQWIMFFEILAQVTDRYPVYENYEEKEPYRGTFSPYVRDIDPTILIQKTHKNSSHTIDAWWHPVIELDWNMDNNLWAVSAHDLPPIEPFLTLTDEAGTKWVCLNAILDWDEKVARDDNWKTPRKKLYYMIQSYLIKNDRLGELISWGQKENQNFFGRWMPDNSDRYELFNREYCWSEGTQYFYGHTWENIRNTDFEVIPTAYHYWWEESTDFSKEGTLSFLKPTKVIFDNLNMQYGDEDGSLYDRENQKICFDPSAQIESTSMLLIQKDIFMNFLKENNLSLFWTVIGEKMIVGGDDRKNTKRSVYSGFYTLDGNQVKGEMKCMER